MCTGIRHVLKVESFEASSFLEQYLPIGQVNPQPPTESVVKAKFLLSCKPLSIIKPALKAKYV